MYSSVFTYFLVAGKPLYLTLRLVLNVGVGVGVDRPSHVEAIHSCTLRRILISMIALRRDLTVLVLTCLARKRHKFVKLLASKLQL